MAATSPRSWPRRPSACARLADVSDDADYLRPLATYAHVAPGVGLAARASEDALADRVLAGPVALGRTAAEHGDMAARGAVSGLEAAPGGERDGEALEVGAASITSAYLDADVISALIKQGGAGKAHRPPGFRRSQRRWDRRQRQPLRSRSRKPIR